MYKGLLPEDKTLRDIKITNGAKIMVVGSTINDVLAVNTPKEVMQQEVKAEENKKEPLCRQKVGLTAPLAHAGVPLCVHKRVLSFQQHRKVLDKGKPDDIMPAIKGAKVSERASPAPPSGADALTHAGVAPTGTATHSAFIRDVQQVRRESPTHVQAGAGSAVDRNERSPGAPAAVVVRPAFSAESRVLCFSTERTEKVPMGSIKNVVSEPIEGHEDYHMMVTVRSRFGILSRVSLVE